MNRLQALDATVWSGRDDGLGKERFHQKVIPVPFAELSATSKQTLAFLGFCCDEGIRRNQGRLGAKQGPEHLRKALANLCIDQNISQFDLVDVGDIICNDENLEGAQKDLSVVVEKLLRLKMTPIVLGGGHETAWGHFLGLAPYAKDLLVINFDAHYDLRPLIDGQWGSSGTPFTQMAQFCAENKRKFNYLCIGIQKGSNTLALQNRALESNTKTISVETLHIQNLSKTQALLKKAMASHKAIYLSVCLDVFAQAYAPGVSAPQALGVNPWQIVPLLQNIAASGKVMALDIVELSPPFDRDEQTAKLAANLLHSILSSFKVRKTPRSRK